MLADGLLIGSDVDAVDLVVSDVVLDPLTLRAKIGEHAAGLLRDGLELFFGQAADTGDLARDDK